MKNRFLQHALGMTLTLNEHNVACVPGSAFGACGEGFLRCAYATGMEQLKEALERMRRFVKAL